MSHHRKRMKKIREKRVKSLQKQIEKHEEKIEKEEGRLDTTKDYRDLGLIELPFVPKSLIDNLAKLKYNQPNCLYWRKEIDDVFLKQIEDDKDYLEENR